MIDSALDPATTMTTPYLRRRRGTLLAASMAGILACSTDAPSSPNRLSTQEGARGPGADFGSDLPCDVATLLLERCASCHSGQGAPPQLERHADLIAPSAEPGMSVAEACLASMQGTLTAMPPSGLLSAAEIAPFAAWVAAGMPPGACEGLVAPPPAELVCTSARYRSEGDDDDANMFPGRDCNGCHRHEADEEEAPMLAFVGTVYPTVREPDDCIGIGGASLGLRDAAGRSWQLATRAESGNFFMEWPSEGIAFPVRASVQFGGVMLEMQQELASPDDLSCNRCHTQDGANGAPGRIFTP